MIVTCGNCDTQFRLDDSKLKPSGLRVRCSICKTAFFVEPPESDEDVYDQIAAEAAEDPASAPGATYDPAVESESEWDPNGEPAPDGPLDPWEPENDWEFVGAQDAEPALGEPAPEEEEEEAPFSDPTDLAGSVDEEAIGIDPAATDAYTAVTDPGIDLDLEGVPDLEADAGMDLDPGIDLDPEPGALDGGGSYAEDVPAPDPAPSPPLAVTVPDLDLGAEPEFDLDPGPLGDLDSPESDFEAGPDPIADIGASSEAPPVAAPEPMAQPTAPPGPMPATETGASSASEIPPEAAAPSLAAAADAPAAVAMSAAPEPLADLDKDDDWGFLEGLGSDGPHSPVATATPTEPATPVATAPKGEKKSRVARRMADAALPSLPSSWSGERWTFLRRSALAIGWVVVGAVTAASLFIGLAPSLLPAGAKASLAQPPGLPAGIDGRSVRAQWIENTAGGWLLVVSGQQRSHAGWEGRYAVVRLLDAEGNVFDPASAAVGPGMPGALLREQDPHVLRDGQETAARRQAWLPPADRRFHAVLTRVPAAARSFEFDVAAAPPIAAPPIAAPPIAELDAGEGLESGAEESGAGEGAGEEGGTEEDRIGQGGAS